MIVDLIQHVMSMMRQTAEANLSHYKEGNVSVVWAKKAIGKNAECT